MPRNHGRKLTGTARKKDQRVLRGSAFTYLTRNQSLKKLQLSLPEFRKLCILKGIYPRKPHKAPKGKDKTYYLRKDILYLMHDPLLAKFAAHRAWKKKLKRYKDKKMTDSVTALRASKPVYSLNHLVKERYPTFVDALGDLDDALCMVYLFSVMPATVKIHTKRSDNCRRLAREFNNYIVLSNSLRKSFLSHRGIFYQAEVMGQKLTWLIPYQFTNKVVKDVDYKVMLTFLEFYEVLMGFVNYKLYQTLGLTYPPVLSKEKIEEGADGLDAIVRELKEATPSVAPLLLKTTPLVLGKGSQPSSKKGLKAQEESKKNLSSLGDALAKIAAAEEDSEAEVSEPEIVDEEGDDSSEEENEEDDDDASSEGPWEGNDAAEKKEGEAEADTNLDEFATDSNAKLLKKMNVYASLFSKFHFWVSREVSLHPLQFVIAAFGGKVSFYTESGTVKENDPSITHHISDRPRPPKTRLNRDYIQPQWVFDCINHLVILPASTYAPGTPLPPHLSPFVDDVAEGYIPEYRKTIDEVSFFFFSFTNWNYFALGCSQLDLFSSPW
eukprot:TRINITY_DN1128_c0_g1_i2.p1 TRINITY_DN1128_c0_g1~~TRINITY_DN1128_c0_g1_i2.p1  ORF type:complete len:552 (-),score=149.36 TRINITY_DN1128_c0_g1_i2:494-2149(-)